MTSSNSLATKLSPYLLSLMRLAVGILFVSHGAQKLLGYPPGGHRPDPFISLAGLSAVLELGGGALILVGFMTRPVAFILSGEMAFAYFMVHAKRGLWPIQNGGELAVLYCFVFLYLAAAGAGPLSVDGARKKA